MQQNPALRDTPEFDESGYIAVPKCVWRKSKFCLPPLDVDGFTLHMVKKASTAWGHYCEMAGKQPWVYEAISCKSSNRCVTR